MDNVKCKLLLTTTIKYRPAREMHRCAYATVTCDTCIAFLALEILSLR
jgi:hypothetical protein